MNYIVSPLRVVFKITFSQFCSSQIILHEGSRSLTSISGNHKVGQTEPGPSQDVNGGLIIEDDTEDENSEQNDLLHSKDL